ncbi:ATPase F0F1 [Leptospira hartskeerlii]|uniref:ATPase F0F1 n=1 Tax=Leptospira hartskeerlii TaxID=2023177 RepID=A0A2M9XD12_9LEPT|nr:AtpZ/AtpI family protein [Leptospira hartskeerlii]PJZ25462.1 ATPase F0F1 [Leptospira hartskeerlii]PJZ32559.1 ATPase F0F1 [Leptospira hartskeerlii]
MSEPDQKPPENKDASPWQLASVGTEFAFIIIASVFIGRYLDGRFGWSPFGILFGAIFGFGYGIYYLLTRVSQFDKKD